MAQTGSAALRVVVIAMLCLSLAVLSWLTANYQNICPKTPNEQAGAVYPLDVRGRVVYLTLAEHRKFFASEACFIALWLCMGAVEIRRRWLRRAEGRNTPAPRV